MEFIGVDEDNGGPIETLSSLVNVLGEKTRDDYGEDSRFVTDKRGFAAILDSMVADLKAMGVKIMLETDVQKVDTDNAIVYTDGSTIQGDLVICTASIGVL